MTDYTRQYVSFRSNIPQKRVSVSESVTWTLYDAGPKEVFSPIIFLPPVAGQADVFFKQLLNLSAFGYRAISVEYPVCWTVRQFCTYFHRLLDTLKLGKVHLFGSGLGGFLALKFAEFMKNSRRVVSVILCNSFTDSSFFSPKFPSFSSKLFWLLPHIVLKRAVRTHFQQNVSCDKSIVQSYDFMKISLDNLDQSELSSRLTLHCSSEYVQPQYLKYVHIMIIETTDSGWEQEGVSEETGKCFPGARRALLKDGGTFPFLSRPDHTNLFIQVHLKQFFSQTSCPLGRNSSLLKLSHLASQQPTH